MIPPMLIWTALATGALPPVDGALLPLGDSCYSVVTANGSKEPAGQVLRRVERRGDKLRITVISRFNDGPLLTSRMELAFPSLRPISTVERTDGKTGLSVRYGASAARGTVTTDDDRRETSTAPLPGPVWDDETLEFVLAALPLAEGAHFELPTFHFGRGPGVTQIDVRRSLAVDAPGHDPVDAWEVAASTRSDMTVTFAVAKADRRLLTVEVGDVRSVLGGDCRGLLG